MNKKVCLVSDIHFGVNKNSEMFLKSSLQFFEKQLAPYLRDNDISTILILGDVFDNRNSINVRINDEINNLLSDTLSEFDIKILIGNHDIYYKTTTDVHSLKYFNYLPNVEVIDEIQHKEILGTNVLFCPWIVDYDNPDWRETLEHSDAEILFGHFDIVGFALNRTRISTDGVDAGIFSNFDTVFSGHYHTPSSKKVEDTEIVYLGSPYQMTRNDSGEHNGFIVLDLETNEYERVVNEESIRFVRVEYPEIPSKEDIEGNIVDAIISIEKKDIVGNIIDKYIEKLEKLNPIDKVNVVLNITDSEANSDFSADSMTSIPSLMELYINSADDIENKSELLKAIMAIYEEVN